jgi:hypothetical protein
MHQTNLSGHEMARAAYRNRWTLGYFAVMMALLVIFTIADYYQG